MYAFCNSQPALLLIAWLTVYPEYKTDIAINNKPRNIMVFIMHHPLILNWWVFLDQKFRTGNKTLTEQSRPDSAVSSWWRRLPCFELLLTRSYRAHAQQPARS